jgi:hypothetical protein
MVFQNYALYPHMSVYDNMAYGLRNLGTPKDEIDARVKEAARILAIEPLLERRPSSSRAASASASPWAAPSCASRRSSCSTSRSPNLDAKTARADARRDQEAAARARRHRDLCHA